jgi:hypothetical protein
MASRRRGELIAWGDRLPGLLLVAVLVLAGCGKATPDGMITVTGTVACGGKPLPKGAVHLVPADATKAALARIDGSGRFRADVWPLDYRIAVTADEQPAYVDDNGREIPAQSLVPLKYTSVRTSGLSATVDADHRTVTLDLAP